MRRPAVLFALLLAAAALPVPEAAAQPAPVPVALYLSSTTATIGTVTAETLTTAAPTKAEDSTKDLAAPASWYSVPGTLGVAGEATFSGDVAGTAYFLTTPTLPVPFGATLQSTVTFELRKLLGNGSEVFLGNDTAALSVQLSPPVANVTQVAFAIPAPNQSLLAGEGLVLNISAVTTGLGSLSLLYDSTARPTGMNLTLAPVARGNLQLSSSPSSREGAPGSTQTYSVRVQNLADIPDAVALNISGSPPEWTIRATATSFTVQAGSQQTVLVSVVIPSGAAEQARHTATVTATSGNGGAPQSITLTTTARAAQGTPGDRDGDGYTDADETRYSSDPNNRNSTPDTTDSDGDGVSNRAEVDAGTDPFDGGDFPGAGDGGTGTAGGGGAGPLAFLSDPIAQSMGVDQATADLIAIVLLLLFLLILLLLLWFLLIGGYPVAVSLVEAKAVTEPGRGADYAVEVRSRLGRAQQVDLEAAGLPSDWDVRFNKPSLNLEAKQSETVGMLVRPPDAWPAPSKRDFEVRARSRLKPGKFAKAVAKMLIQPRPAMAAELPAEEGVAEAPEEAYRPPAAPYVAPAPVAGAPFRVGIHDVRHSPAVPERGGEVTTTARIENNGAAPEAIRVVLVVNGKVRDEVRVELQPREGAEAEFHWVAYLARNEVKVVAERA